MGLQGRMDSQAGGKAFKAPAETRPAAAAAATAPPARPSTPSAAPSAPVQHVLQDEVLSVLRGEHAAPLAQPEAAGLVRGHHPAPPLAVLLCEEARLRDGEGRVDELLAVHQRGVFGVADLRARNGGGGLTGAVQGCAGGGEAAGGCGCWQAMAAAASGSNVQQAAASSPCRAPSAAACPPCMWSQCAAPTWPRWGPAWAQCGSALQQLRRQPLAPLPHRAHCRWQVAAAPPLLPPQQRHRRRLPAAAPPPPLSLQ